MDNILLILLSCCGLTLTLKYGKPTAFIRNFLARFGEAFRYLTKCSLCLGFWSGTIHGIIIFNTTDIAIWLPFASAAASFFLDSLIQCIQMIEIYLKRISEK